MDFAGDGEQGGLRDVPPDPTGPDGGGQAGKRGDGRPFFARYDPEAIWLDDLTPALGERRFFFETDDTDGSDTADPDLLQIARGR